MSKRKSSKSPEQLFGQCITFKYLDYNTNVKEALTFYPTEKEFCNPIDYVKRIAPLAQPYGICKIVPPKQCSLSTSLSTLTSALTEKQFQFTTKIQNIDQLQFRSARNLIDNKRKMVNTPPRAKRIKLKEQEHSLTEFGFERTDDEISLRSFKCMADTFKQEFFSKCLKQEEPIIQEAFCNEQEEEEEENIKISPSKSRKRVKRLQESSSDPLTVPPIKHTDHCDYNTTTENKPLPRPVLQKLARRAGLDRMRGVRYYESIESMSSIDVDSEYWNTVDNYDQTTTRKVTVQYGSDLDCSKVGSCFPKTWQYGWNMNKLAILDDSVLKYLYQTIPGITSPMLYVGMLFSSFCWHVEDNHLCAINYIHSGANKTWYAIPGSAAQTFEKVMQETLPDLFAIQPNLLHMLITMLSPRVLQEHHVPIYRMEHEAGTFIVTYPRAYHAGFNHGFNIAESVNFSPGTWIPYGRICLNRYHRTHRPTAFAHDQIICTAAMQDNIALFTADVHDIIILELEMIIRIEGQLRQYIQNHVKITRKEPMPDSKKHPHRTRKVSIQKDNKICLKCRQDCYLSAIMIEPHVMQTSMEPKKRSNMGTMMGMKAIQNEEGEPNEPFVCLKCVESFINKHNIKASDCTLVERYTLQQLNELLKDARQTPPKKYKKNNK